MRVRHLPLGVKAVSNTDHLQNMSYHYPLRSLDMHNSRVDLRCLPTFVRKKGRKRFLIHKTTYNRKDWKEKVDSNPIPTLGLIRFLCIFITTVKPVISQMSINCLVDSSPSDVYSKHYRSFQKQICQSHLLVQLTRWIFVQFYQRYEGTAWLHGNCLCQFRDRNLCKFYDWMTFP